jgi:hypothetical protein
LPKRLLLGALEAPVSQLEKAEEAVNYVLKNRFPDMIFKVFSYAPDYPEELTYYVGQTMKFITNSRFVPNGSNQMEEQSEEEKGWRAATARFWTASKPHLKEFVKEIYYSKQQLAEIREKERVQKQKDLDISKGPIEQGSNASA